MDHSIGHICHIVQAQESPFDSGATNRVFFTLGRKRSGNKYDAMVTS